MTPQLYIFRNGKAVPTKDVIEQHRQQTVPTEISTEVQRWDDDGGKIPGVAILNSGPKSRRSAWEAFGEDDINE
jgi:hypothetical protein